MTNNEIFDIYWNNGLIRRCISCQFAKDKAEYINMEDFQQDLCLILLTYDNDKLNDAHRKNHMNALISRMIVNNIFSKQSPYYAKYKRFKDRTEEITPEILKMTDDYEFVGAKGNKRRGGNINEVDE